MPNLADEIERLLAAEAQAYAAYQAAERSWGIGKQSSTHSERTARDAAYDATTYLLRSRAPAIVATLRRIERLEAAIKASIAELKMIHEALKEPTDAT